MFVKLTEMKKKVINLGCYMTEILPKKFMLNIKEDTGKDEAKNITIVYFPFHE